ncbi:rod shape-determining protein RodA [Heliobacterium undosum]|uniref:Peptidoglycan glycosyltransferase RodA n=1 Tax=Heliomicrobium undosum TaxID=121734 RepID=A0A845LB40_9FIRM|nr:rod shape-determining protein RodA [Heliomicrobium undosum]MZP30141.1 rod shape-determining protein RodA [Heliomicrobium undosum]
MRLKLARNLDLTLVAVVLLLLTFSIVIMRSASSNVGADPLAFARKQTIWVFIGIAFVIISMFFHYQTLSRYSWYLYGLNLLILIAVLLPGLGVNVNGAVRWINIGGFQFQPSEFAKLLMIITFADFLSKRQGRMETLKDLLPCFAFVAVPMLPILKQPDLGTSLVFIAIMLGMLAAAGANKKVLGLLVFSGLVVVIVAIYGHLTWGWPLPLKEYQIKRLIIFLDPDLDPLGDGYHIRQSLVAIGSGGLFGKGLFQGTQAQLNFLPEHHTDFVFSVVGEELGFIGAVGLLALFFVIILRGLRIALDARDTFGSLIVTGIVSMWLFHVLVNVGMTTGIMPVTGIPLPFVSYGGSAMLTNLVCLGLLLNVYWRRQSIMF